MAGLDRLEHTGGDVVAGPLTEDEIGRGLEADRGSGQSDTSNPKVAEFDVLAFDALVKTRLALFEAGAIESKLLAAQMDAGPGLLAITHAYGPLADAVERFRAAWAASAGRVEINRYGYMSDQKLLEFARVAAVS